MLTRLFWLPFICFRILQDLLEYVKYRLQIPLVFPFYFCTKKKKKTDRIHSTNGDQLRVMKRPIFGLRNLIFAITGRTIWFILIAEASLIRHR